MDRPTKSQEEINKNIINILNKTTKLSFSLNALLLYLDNERRPGASIPLQVLRAKEALKDWEDFIRGT